MQTYTNIFVFYCLCGANNLYLHHGDKKTDYGNGNSIHSCINKEV